MPKIVAETCFPLMAQLDGTCNMQEVRNVKMVQTLTFKCSGTRLVFSGSSKLACSSLFVKRFPKRSSRTGSRVIDPKCCWKLEARTIMNAVASRNVRLHRAKDSTDAHGNCTFPHMVPTCWSKKFLWTLRFRTEVWLVLQTLLSWRSVYRKGTFSVWPEIVIQCS